MTYCYRESSVFEQSFGAYAKNKVRLFIGDGEETAKTVWEILQEVFTLWKRCHRSVLSSHHLSAAHCFRLANNFIGEHGSKIVAESLFEGVTSKWEVVLNIILGVICAAETPFAAAREIGTVQMLALRRNQLLAFRFATTSLLMWRRRATSISSVCAGASAKRCST